MISLQVRYPDGTVKSLTFDKPEISIGRDAAIADVVVQDGAVSKMHAVIAKLASGLVLTDLKSTNGTMVSGKVVPPNEPIPVPPGTVIGVGAARILIEVSPAKVATSENAEGVEKAETQVMTAISNVMTALKKKNDFKAFNRVTLPPTEAVRAMEEKIVLQVGQAGLKGDLADRVTAAVRRELLETGPMGPWLEDPEISAIQCMSFDRIDLTRNGVPTRSRIVFTSGQAMLRAMIRLVAESGKPRGKTELIVERRIQNGGQLVAFLVPGNNSKLSMSIRKRLAIVSKLDVLTASNVLSDRMADYLSRCIEARANVLICGTNEHAIADVAAALTAASDAEHSIGVFHAGSEVRVPGRRTVAFGLPPNDEERALRAGIQLGLDHLVVLSPKVRVAAAAAIACCSGTSGVIVGFPSRDVTRGLASLGAELMLTRPGLTPSSASEIIATAFDVVVEIARDAKQRPYVMRIATIESPRPNARTPTLRELFTSTKEEDGKIVFAATGANPRVSSPPI